MLPRLAIFGGFDNMVSISLKSWSFDLFCGLCIFAHLRLQTSFLWRWKMAGFCMIYALRICRFMAKEPPKHFSCSIFFCHFAKLSTPKTQLWVGVPCLLLISFSTYSPLRLEFSVKEILSILSNFLSPEKLTQKRAKQVCKTSIFTKLPRIEAI